MIKYKSKLEYWLLRNRFPSIAIIQLNINENYLSDDTEY